MAREHQGRGEAEQKTPPGNGFVAAYLRVSVGAQR